MKKTLCLLLSVILFFTLSAVNVFALDDSSLQSANDDETANEQAVDSMVVFGDSISAGFGLPDFDFNDNSKAAQSFSNLLCQRYHLTYGKNCFNFSHSGYDSAEILSDVKAADKGILKNADAVIFSLGTNDILKVFDDCIQKEYSENQESWVKAGAAIDSGIKAPLIDSVLSLFAAKNKTDAQTLMLSDSIINRFQKQSKDAVLKCEANIKETISYLREIGCQGEIYFVSPYEAGYSLYQNALFNHLHSVFRKLCDTMIALSESREYGYSVSVIDLMSDFEDQYQKMTLVQQSDIHLSKDGHLYVADKIEELNKLNQKQRISEQNTLRHRTAPYSNTIVLVIFGAACAAVITIIIYSIITRRKK